MGGVDGCVVGFADGSFLYTVFKSCLGGLGHEAGVEGAVGNPCLVINQERGVLFF